MFSDGRQLGRQRAPLRHAAPQHWLHNGAALQREAARMGPSAQTEAAPLPPGRRQPPQPPDGKGSSHVRERADAGSAGRSSKRRPPLAEQSRATQPEPVSQSGPPGSSSSSSSFSSSSGSARRSQAPEPRQKRASAGREPLKERVCSSRGCQTQPHPSGRKYVPPPPAGFKGQDGYGAPGFVVERQFWGYAGERGSRVSGQAHAPTRGFHRQHVSHSAFVHGQEYANYNHGLRDLTGAKSRQEQGCNGPSLAQGLIFSAEVPGELDCSGQRRLCWPGGDATHVQNKCPSAEQGQKKDPAAGKPKMSQAVVRDQIRRVVGDLEGVLGGLKQVHLEMKEVVQQIELLTSNIDLGEDDPSNSFPSDTLCSSSSSGVMVSSHRGAGSHQPKRPDPVRASLAGSPAHSNPPALNPSVVVAKRTAVMVPYGGPPRGAMGVPPANLPRDQSREPVQPHPALPKPAFHGQNQATDHRPGGPTCRSKKPPPYPHNGQVAKVGKGREPLKAPPYPAKRRLLTTMV